MCPVRSVTYVSGRSSCEPDCLVEIVTVDERNPGQTSDSPVRPGRPERWPHAEVSAPSVVPPLD
jgi:hypothetical protein